MTTKKTKSKIMRIAMMTTTKTRSDRFTGEQQSVEGGVGQAENCSGCKSHWRDQVISITFHVQRVGGWRWMEFIIVSLKTDFQG